MSEFLSQAVDFIRHMPTVPKILALILAVMVEYVLPVFPGDTVVLLAGFLNAHGALELLEICFAVVIGTILGSLLGYSIGLYIAKNPTKYAWIKKITSSQGFIKFNIWYEKWGSIFLLVNRFIPGIRALFFFAAGSARLPLSKVLVLGMLSALLFNAALIAAGNWLGYNSDLILTYFYRYNFALYILLALALLIAGLWWWRKSHK